VHLQKPFEPFGYMAGSMPVAEEIGRTELSLPMYAELSTTQIEGVVAAVKKSV